MVLRILFVLDFIGLCILTFVSLITGQRVWSNNNNANIRTGLYPGMGFATGYQPSGSGNYDSGEVVSNFNYGRNNYGLQLRNDFSLPFNKPGGFAPNSKFSDGTSGFIPLTETNANRRDIEKTANLNYKFHDWVSKFGSRNNYRNGLNIQPAGANVAYSRLGNVPFNNQNSGFNIGNTRITNFPGGTTLENNRNGFNSEYLNNGAVKTIGSSMPRGEPNTGFNKQFEISEAETFSAGSIASPGYTGSGNFPTVFKDGVFPDKNRNNQVFAPGLPFDSADSAPEISQFDKTATPDRTEILNTSNEELYKTLPASDKMSDDPGREEAAKEKISGERRSRSKNNSKTENLRPKISYGSDLQDGYDIIKGTDDENVGKDANENIDTTTTETSPVPVKKDPPSFLASALNKFDTPSTVHYITSAASLLVSDDEFDLATLPSVILALTMQIRSAFPGLSNCELLNQVFLELIIALGHILKHSKVGDVNFDGISETADLVMKAF